MQLQTTNPKRYSFLPSGVLIVEPNPALLAARTQLVSAADYYVAASDTTAPGTELRRADVTVAILSRTLGKETLRKLAQEIRTYYPSASILIFGYASLILDDQLYDESIDDHCRPEQLLDLLFRLSQIPRKYPIRAQTKLGLQLLSLGGLNWTSLRKRLVESDPTKEAAPSLSAVPAGRDVPSDESAPHLV
jgi:hypothetical protein